jgi:hypothetical protein
MAKVNRVQKNTVMLKHEVIKFQIVTHCYIYHIAMSESDLNCLTLLSMAGSVELSHFCNDISSDDDAIFKSPQTVRNCINKAKKIGLVIKDANNKKLISINPNLKIQTKGVIFLDYKFLGK